jgi:hypothetical protein
MSIEHGRRVIGGRGLGTVLARNVMRQDGSDGMKCSNVTSAALLQKVKSNGARVMQTQDAMSCCDAPRIKAGQTTTGKYTRNQRQFKGRNPMIKAKGLELEGDAF